MKNLDSAVRTFLYLVMLFVIVFVIATCTGCSTDVDAQQTETATIVSPPPVYLGPDQDARKHNTPKLMDALKRYLNAHNALRDEMTSYQNEMDVDYDKVHPILEEMTAAIAALDKEVKNFDKATAKGGRREGQSISSSGYVE